MDLLSLRLVEANEELILTTSGLTRSQTQVVTVLSPLSYSTTLRVIDRKPKYWN